MNKKEMIAEDLKKRGRNSQDYKMRGYGYDENIDFGEIIEGTKDNELHVGIVDNELEIIYYKIEKHIWEQGNFKESNNEIRLEDDNHKRAYEQMTAMGLKVNSGFKFGADYRVYSENEEHAPWIVIVCNNEMKWLEMARAIRVSHAVKKNLVFWVNDAWITVRWIRP